MYWKKQIQSICLGTWQIPSTPLTGIIAELHITSRRTRTGMSMQKNNYKGNNFRWFCTTEKGNMFRQVHLCCHSLLTIRGVPFPLHYCSLHWYINFLQLIMQREFAFLVWKVTIHNFFIYLKCFNSLWIYKVELFTNLIYITVARGIHFVRQVHFVRPVVVLK